MPRRRSLSHIILAGLVLSAVPAMTLSRQKLAAPALTQLVMPAVLTQIDGRITAKTELNTLDLSELAGTDNVSVGDVIYVQLNTADDRDNASLKQLAYPYAISQNRPARTDSSTTGLRAIVTDLHGERINVEYLFETLPARKTLTELLSGAGEISADLQLSVNRRAVGHVRAVTVNGTRYDIN